MCRRTNCFIGSFLLIAASVFAQNDYSLSGRVTDGQTREPLAFATVQLKTVGEATFGALTDAEGKYRFAKLPAGKYTITVSYLGYDVQRKPIELTRHTTLSFRLTTSITALNEVVITASESKGMTSASKIDRTAIGHLQPTSFTDLLELLPGSKSVDPAMGSANLIRIREAGNTSETIASLGVGFSIDGATVNNDANLQRVPGTTQIGAAQVGTKESVSLGVDMRTLSTDNIESVEIIRGVPSVEYGNLTGGMVNIRRRESAGPLTARFKADLKSKLFSVGKGWRAGNGKVLNADLSYLDSKVDPRDSRENYRRITGSVRWNSNRSARIGRMEWGANADYTGSFDKVKHDKDITMKEDFYRSSYDKFTLGGKFTLRRSERSLLRQVRVNASLSQELSRIKERKTVGISRPMAIPNSLVQGEADGVYLPFTYVADMLVDGKPLYASLKADANLGFRIGKSQHTLLLGGEWNYSKNFGDGRVYDLNRPITATATTRPRRYADIPALQNLAFYAEERAVLPLRRHRLTLVAGLRSSAMPGLADAYAMSGRFYFDPRFSLKWELPPMGANRRWHIDLSANIGWLLRMPTTAQLYPDPIYVDIEQLNYYHNNPDYRRVNLITYRWDNTNYDLRPARNRKWEVRLNVANPDWGSLSVTYFEERMNNAFRSVSYYRTLPYKKYDASSVNSATLTAPPSLDDMSYRNDTLINVYNRTGNGTRVRKQGVEFTLATQRIKRLKTRFTINGAWLRTTYSNSMPTYKASTILLNNEQLKYIGLYDWEDGTTRESFNTNFIGDTYLPHIGMSLSLSAQCTWYTASKNLWNDGMPVSYVDRSGTVHPFTDADAHDAQLQHLVERYGDTYFDRITVPFAMDVNLKATKEVGRYLQVSMFVNRILSWYPDYHRGTALIRRYSSPYFGMEASVRL